MYTTHGDHIWGTRLGDDNPPLSPPRCGGIERCPDCMLEAAAITKLDYYREVQYDGQTYMRVYESLREAGVPEDLARKAIIVMEDNGILFRERKEVS